MPKTVHEITRKEMKGPDRFQVAASEAAGWMGKHEKLLALGALGVAALALAGVGISHLLESRQAKAGASLYKALEAASGEVSSVPLPGFDHPIYKSAEEREQAVLSAATKVRAEHGGTRAATTAALLEGDAQLALGQWDKAIAAYGGYLDKAPADDSLRFGALDGLARAQEGKGDLAAAAATYERAAGIPFFKDRAMVERARILEKAGKPEDAKKALESVGKDSPLHGEAQARLARLGSGR